MIEDRERCEKSHALSSSKGLDPQHYSTLSEPNLSPPERRDESSYDDDSDDLYAAEDRNPIQEHVSHWNNAHFSLIIIIFIKCANVLC